MSYPEALGASGRTIYQTYRPALAELPSPDDAPNPAARSTK